MSTYVLVHGASHGSWCWQRVTPLLEERGHRVTAVDLPGNGHDDIPPAEVTLDTYAGHVCRILEQQPEPALLVGHSLGGLSISRAAELCPDRVRALVYLTALLLRPGEAFIPVTSESGGVREALLTRTSWDVADDLSHVVYKEELAQHRFYNDCAPEDVAWAKSMLVPQPAAPIVTPMATTEANFGRVPRVYIECLKDQALVPERQREMYANLPCRRVISMDTGHSPFLSAPEELAEHLHHLAGAAA